MTPSPYAALPLLLGLLAGAACMGDFTTPGDVCLHSEGCAGGGGVGSLPSTLVFWGSVNSAETGEVLPGATVLIEAPARQWSETALTGSVGSYTTNGLPQPAVGDCAGLSVTFTRTGYQTLRLVEFPLLTCARGYAHIDARLTPTP